VNNKIKKIPEKFLSNFQQQQTALIKSRLKLAALLLVVCTFLGDIIDILVLQQKINYQMKFTWALSAAICLITYLLARKIRTFKAAQTGAILFTILVLVLITRDSIAYYIAPYDAAMGFIFLFFTFSFIFPWSTKKIVAVSLSHFAAYTIFLINVPKYVYKDSIVNTGVSDYLNGLIMLFLSSIVCFAVIRRERRRDMENFVLLKDVEEKNNQMDKELELATRVHSKLIPRSISTDLADIAVTYVPMHYIGGDYAKFYFIDKNRLMFIICDVTGHGVSAALLINALNTKFERLSKEAKNPGELLKAINQFMVNNFSELNMYVSAFCGLLDFHYLSRKFTYSSYGHPPQYIYHTANPKLVKLSPQTSFLGLPLDDRIIYNSEVSFKKGDNILLFTDGAFEARDPEGNEFGMERIEAYIGKNRGLGADIFNENLLSEIKSFACNDLKDDLFILNIKTK
jgi:serine phosphatase RsbU (regulator of sigma subunit)